MISRQFLLSVSDFGEALGPITESVHKKESFSFFLLQANFFQEGGTDEKKTR